MANAGELTINVNAHLGRCKDCAWWLALAQTSDLVGPDNWRECTMVRAAKAGALLTSVAVEGYHSAVLTDEDFACIQWEAADATNI